MNTTGVKADLREFIVDNEPTIVDDLMSIMNQGYELNFITTEPLSIGNQYPQIIVDVERAYSFSDNGVGVNTSLQRYKANYFTVIEFFSALVMGTNELHLYEQEGYNLDVMADRLVNLLASTPQIGTMNLRLSPDDGDPFNNRVIQREQLDYYDATSGAAMKYVRLEFTLIDNCDSVSI